MATVVFLPLALALDCAGFAGGAFACLERPPPWQAVGSARLVKRGGTAVPD